MVLHVLLDLFSRQAFGIKSATRWHGGGADKGLILFDQVETRAVDQQVVAQIGTASSVAVMITVQK